MKQRRNEKFIARAGFAKAYHQYMYDKVAPRDGTVYSTDHLIEKARAVEKYHAIHKRKNARTYTVLGQETVAGRSHGIAVLPGDSNTIYIGTNGGGIWKTTNGGQNWSPITDDLPILMGSTIAIAPSDPNIIMFGTGDAYGFNARGQGVFKSIDGGQNWTQQKNFVNDDNFFESAAIGYVSGLVIHPTNPDTIVMTTIFHAFKSTDGGLTYNETLDYAGGSSYILEVKQDPSNFRTLYATSRGGHVYKSIDFGDSWTEIATFGTGRVAIAIAESEPNILYASASNGNTLQSTGVWISRDAGLTWNQQISNTDLLGSQSWFNNQIHVNPYDAKEVYVGGLDLWKSVDSGNTFNRKTSWTWKDYGFDSGGPGGPAEQYIHADFHGMISVKTNEAQQKFHLFVSGDGGLHRSKDGGETWEEINNDLYVTQFYSAAFAHDAGDTRYVGGTQDNGDIVTNNEFDWVHSRGGDGGFTEINPQNRNEVYTEYVYLEIHKSTQGGLWDTYTRVTGGIEETNSSNTLFIAPFVMDYSRPTTLYAGTDELWRTTNGATNWQSVASLNTNEKITNIAVSAANPDHVWVVSEDGNVYRSTNQGEGLTQLTTDDGFADRYISDVALSGVDVDVAVITVSTYASNEDKGYVFMTRDAGVTWESLDFDNGIYKIPWASSHTALINPADDNHIFIGTDIGLYETTDGGATWENVAGIPKVQVLDLKVRFIDGMMLIATHGRSIYKTTIEIQYDTIPTNFNFGVIQDPTFPSYATVFVKTSKEVKFTEGHVTSGNVSSDVTFSDFQPDSLIYMANRIQLEPGAETRLSFNARGKRESGGTDTAYTFTPYDPDAQPNIVKVGYVVIDPRGKLVGTRFIAASAVGMNTRTDGIIELKQPVEVAVIGTRDFVEPVPVRMTVGSNDNIDEVAVYSFQNGAWTEVPAFRDGRDLIVEIDGPIELKLGYTGTPHRTEDNPFATRFELGQNYPNPFNPSTTIPFTVKQNGNVTIQIFNMLGQRVRTLVNTQYAAGTYTTVWNGLNDAGTQLPSGLYVYRMTAGNVQFTRKMILMK